MSMMHKLLLFTLITVGLGSWQATSWWARETKPAVLSGTAKPIIVTIEPGSSSQMIADRLSESRVLRSKSAWQVWTRLQSFKNRSGGFQAGSYAVSPQESLPEIADKIWTGQVVTKGFTIPEGWNIRQMAAHFEEKKFFTAEQFINAIQQFPNSPAATQTSWLPKNLPLIEGFLFPDTYEIPAGTVTPEQVIQQMLDRFKTVALPIYQANQNQDPLKLDLLQWVTLASIVEKEAVIPKERPIISGVFTNRLKTGMSLGSDPTVEYAFGITQTPEKPLTLTQVRTPSPYNTYINPGLPPTPIASPGLASLQATLAPQTTDALYFVARYDGTHVFSRSLAEHESAQEQIRDRVDNQPSPTPSAKPKS
ncbi:MAG: endolytic transglycosylase MltG [Alkalinema sp. CAN_BIN05]|nr:endolytic transglycosylase MltG [Alkalinema sp. CAN_BIN05]